MDEALALALDYPDETLLARRAEVAAALPERLAGFARWWAGADPLALQERWVADFDLRGGTALHLTYHRFGDRRDRGRALIALKRCLREAGWELDHWELPDYLPLLVEFAAVEPEAGARLLADFRAELEAIRRVLLERESPWAGLLAEICAALPPADEEAVARLLDDGPPTELVGLEEARA